jgi:hypothetical protein
LPSSLCGTFVEGTAQRDVYPSTNFKFVFFAASLIPLYASLIEVFRNTVKKALSNEAFGASRKKRDI